MADTPQKKPAPQAQAKRSPPEAHGAELVIGRAYFYRDMYRTVTKALLIVAGIAVISVAMNGILISKLINKKAIYFGLTADGRAIEMQPMDKPTITEANLLHWAARAAVCPFSYDFANYRDQLALCQPNFTESGWDTFATELKSSKTLELVKTQNLVLSSSIISSPAIYQKGIFNGKLSWIIDVPVRVRYAGRENTTTQDFKVTLTVVRVDQLLRPDTAGVAISSIVTTGYKEE